MRKAQELTRPDSCLNKALPEEPIFVLLGRDVAAPYAIRMWAAERWIKGKNISADRQINEALELANAMEEWQKGRSVLCPTCGQPGCHGGGIYGLSGPCDVL